MLAALKPPKPKSCTWPLPKAIRLPSPRTHPLPGEQGEAIRVRPKAPLRLALLLLDRQDLRPPAWVDLRRAEAPAPPRPRRAAVKVPPWACPLTCPFLPVASLRSKHLPCLRKQRPQKKSSAAKQATPSTKTVKPLPKRALGARASILTTQPTRICWKGLAVSARRRTTEKLKATKAASNAKATPPSTKPPSKSNCACARRWKPAPRPAASKSYARACPSRRNAPGTCTSVTGETTPSSTPPPTSRRPSPPTWTPRATPWRVATWSKTGCPPRRRSAPKSS